MRLWVILYFLRGDRPAKCIFYLFHGEDKKLNNPCEYCTSRERQEMPRDNELIWKSSSNTNKNLHWVCYIHHLRGSSCSDLNIACFGEVSRVLRACHKASFCFSMDAISQPSKAMNYVSKSQTVNIFSLIIILPVWLHNYPKRRQIKLPHVTAHFALKLQDIPFMSFIFL